MKKLTTTRHLVSTVALFGMCAGPSVAAAAVISLTGGPVTGRARPGQAIDVVVGYDPNGVAATNVVSHFVSLGFTGLGPDGSVVKGSLYDGFSMFDGVAGDLIDSSGGGDCTTPGACTLEVEAAGFIALLPPSVTQGPGSLFSMRLRPGHGASDWSFDLFGDTEAALFWEPPFTCDVGDLDCGSQPQPVPFAIVRVGDPSTPAGTARVTIGVRVTEPPPPPVPEPSASWLVLASVAAWVFGLRRGHTR
jgi:hypothetical protein